MLNTNELDSFVLQYVSFRRAEGLKETTLRDTLGRIRQMAKACGFALLSDVNEHRLNDWFIALSDKGMSAGTRRLLFVYAFAFFDWMVAREHLPKNPMANCPRPRKLKRDIRKRRRALTEAEFKELVRVAKLRPLAEYAKMRLVGSRNPAFWAANPITPANIEHLANEARNMLHHKEVARKEIDGLKWALIYKTLGWTGLRWGELRALQVRQVYFAESSCLTLDPMQEKNGNGSSIPIKAELAAELKDWITARGLGPHDPIFQMPSKGMKRFCYDREAAGIIPMDANGRSIDLHALRYTFATFLSLAGVAPRTAMKLMRHSKMDLTMSLYTDATQLDGVSAAESLTSLNEQPQAKPEAPAIEPPKQEQQVSLLNGDLSSKLLASLMKSCDAETLKAALLASM